VHYDMINVSGIILPPSADKIAEKALLQKLGGLYAGAKERYAAYATTLSGGGKSLKTASRALMTSFAVKFTAALAASARCQSYNAIASSTSPTCAMIYIWTNPILSLSGYE